ncbi:MAG TPA: DUF58 domain-containing protein [Ktedonobacteraceae bacterium]|nr:DUF58 domain-containing protein [Ktedonobacteraceae bacterium]
MNTMETDLLPIEPDKTLIKNRRLWYYLAGALFVLTLITQQPLALVATIFTLVIGFVPEQWYRNALRHLVIRQQVNHRHVFFGEEVTLSISIENQKLLPLPWLQVEDAISPPLTVLNKQNISRLQNMFQDTLISTWLLWSFQRVTRRYRLRCHSRGFHVFGPVKLRSSDPFGWIESELTVPTRETLLVYPLIAPLETLGLPPFHPMGDYASQRQLLEDPLWFAGVREYELGDDPRRIHWKATARAGELRSKIYEPTSLRRLLILLDTWNHSSEWVGIDFDIQEFCITVAGSIAVWGLSEGYMVGLLTNSSIVTGVVEQEENLQTNARVLTPEQEVGTDRARKNASSTKISPPGINVPFSLEHGQYERILSTLACLVPNYNTPIERFIDAEESMFPIGTTIVLVSAASTLNEATVERLLDRRAHGSAVHLVLADNLEEGKELTETYDLPVHHIGGRETWHELVRTVCDGKSEAVGTSSTSLQLD